MVIVQIRSGLGNQMFQYAFARQLALKNGVQLRLDASFYRNYPLRRYELESLSITAKELGPSERIILRASSNRRFPALKKLAELVHGGGPLTFLTDRQCGFDETANAARGNIYLQGFWQSWKYFADIRPLLLKEFTVSLPSDSWNAAMTDQIQNSTSVCIHVRRGDYTENPDTASTFGACSLNYYLNAIAYIKERIPNPTFFVFSDDLNWVKEQLGNGANFKYMDHNRGLPPAHDLRLMHLCKHFILSNSTFGWWAAWLSESTGKIVVSPKNWYKANWTTLDLLPPGWITLPNELI